MAVIRDEDVEPGRAASCCGGIVGGEESLLLLVNGGPGCMSMFWPSSCVGLAGVRGDIGTGTWTVFGSLRGLGSI